MELPSVSNIIGNLTPSNSTTSKQPSKPSTEDVLLAISQQQASLNSSIISSLGTSSTASTSNSGLSSDFLYNLYQSKMITPQEREIYFDKLKAQSTDTTDSTSNNTTANGLTNQASSTLDELLSNPTTSLPDFSTSAGYDTEAVKKIYQDMQNWYSKPDNEYRDYPGTDSSNSVDILA